MAQVGDMAKRFSLKDQNDQDFNLEDYIGKKVLLSFHPLAFTSVCAQQMKSLEQNQDTFAELNTVAVGVWWHGLAELIPMTMRPPWTLSALLPSSCA